MTLPLAPESIYRIVTDYEGVQDAFSDRIEDINVPLTEVDAVAGMTRGNMQKLLVKSDAKWAREFGWKTLGDALKGTGMVLAFILDDEKFAPIKAQMMKRKVSQRTIVRSRPPTWLFSRSKSVKMLAKRWSDVPPNKRKKIARKLGIASGKSRRAKARKSAQCDRATS